MVVLVVAIFKNCSPPVGRREFGILSFIYRAPKRQLPSPWQESIKSLKKTGISLALCVKVENFLRWDQTEAFKESLNATQYPQENVFKQLR